MPLKVDKPINFGLQCFCSNCLKCARECPCDAIPWGDAISAVALNARRSGFGYTLRHHLWEARLR
jgi:hypothetical protein